MGQNGVLRDAADQKDSLVLDVSEKLEHFLRHHLAQSGGDASFRFADVQGVGAIALAEDGASSCDFPRNSSHPESHCFLDGEIHPPNLLKKELARAGGAFVPRMNGYNFAVFAEGIDHEGFPPGANNGIVPVARSRHERKRPLDRLRLRDGRKIHVMAKLPPCRRDGIVGSESHLPEHLGEHRPRIPFMRFHGEARHGYLPVLAGQLDNLNRRSA